MNKNQPKQKIGFVIKENILVYLWSILSILGGIALVSFSQYLDSYFHYILGAVLILMSLASFIFYFVMKEYTNSSNYRLIKCIIIFAIGLLISASPRSPIFVCVIWGAFSILKSAFEFHDIVQAFHHKEYQIVRLFLAIIEFVLGIILLLELTDALGHHIMFLGISFIIHGISYFVLALNGGTFRARREKKKKYECKVEVENKFIEKIMKMYPDSGDLYHLLKNIENKIENEANSVAKDENKDNGDRKTKIENETVEKK